jgi:metal transporter CNNM
MSIKHHHYQGMTVYTKREIATMMMIQHEEGERSHGKGKTRNKADSLHFEEVTIIDGALKFRDTLVCDVMTPVAKCFMLSCSEKLTNKTLSSIFKSGYSRIPVYERDRDDVVGILLTKDLLFLDPEDEIPVSSFIRLFGRRPVVAWHDERLGEILTTFKKEKSHIAVVRNVNSTGPGDPFYELVRIILLC